MASGTLGVNDSNSRERRRWGEGNNKVYTRKIHNKGLKSTAATTASTASTAVVTSVDDKPVNNCNSNCENKLDTVGTNDGHKKKNENNHETEVRKTDKSNVKNVAENHQFSQTLANEEANSSSGIANEVEVLKPVVTRVDGRVKIDLQAAKSKNDFRELKRQLASELDQVRTLVQRLEAKEMELTSLSNAAAVVTVSGGYDHSQYLANDVRRGVSATRVDSDAHVREVLRPSYSNVSVGGGGYSRSQYSADDGRDGGGLARAYSDAGSVGHRNSRPFRQLGVSVMNNHRVGGEFVEKEKRTPKANQYYRNSEFLLGKDRLPPESNKKVKSNGGKKHGGDTDFRFDKLKIQAFKSCGSLLQRLMKHKYGWVFNEPVNAKALLLHDYHDIIKHPMDLGTIKSRLAQNYYKFPREFAEDVRLTFHNAMTYNPKGHDVYVMAEDLLRIFEERWKVIEMEYKPEWRYQMYLDAGLQLPTPTSRKAPLLPPPTPSVFPTRTFERSESITVSADPKMKPSIAHVARMPVLKKPKAKDPNKRDMSYEEKQKLSTNLQNLPSEKLDNIVQIIKKRNSSLSQHDDEIEVDIDSVDAETLWELDRFVTNYKKSLSKNKRKAELALQARAVAARTASTVNPSPATEEARKESNAVERNISTSPVQGDKLGDNASRSSSSSSSSSDSGSSSSDSDSDSSSASGSDAETSPRS